MLSSNTGEPLKSFSQENVIQSAVFSPNGNWILTAGWDRTARMWNIATGMQDGPSMLHPNDVSGAVFSPDGRWILTAGYDNAARLWDVATKKQITAFAQDSTVNSAVFNARQSSILTATHDSKATLFEIPGDLDIPVTLFKLQAQVITGAQYNVKTNETECMQPASWNLLYKEYEAEAKQHEKTCKYPRYNIWRRFYKAEEGKPLNRANQ